MDSEQRLDGGQGRLDGNSIRIYDSIEEEEKGEEWDARGVEEGLFVEDCGHFGVKRDKECGCREYSIDL